MRIAFLIVITLYGIGASFSDAFYGLLLYTFYSFAHPFEMVKWTNFASFRVSYITALVVIGTAILQKKKLVVKHSITILCVCFLGQCYVSMLVAEGAISSVSSDYATMLLKIYIIMFISASLISSFSKFKTYMIASAAFLGFPAAYYGFFGLLAGSTSITGNMAGDNNAYAAWLNTSAPFVYYVGSAIKDKKWRFVFMAAFIGNILAVLLTFSRAGSLTLCVILTIIFFQKMKKFLVLIIPIGLIALFLLMPDRAIQDSPSWTKSEKVEKKDTKGLSPTERTKIAYEERMMTMKQPVGEIDSSRSRIHFWITAIDMGNANPFFGVGFQRYQNAYNQYDDSYGRFGGSRALHSTVLQTLAEMGYVGFFLFCSILISYFAVIKSSKIRAMEYMKEMQERREFIMLLDALTISMLAYLINSSFVNCLYFETLWSFIGVAVAVDIFTKKLYEENIALQAGANE